TEATRTEFIPFSEWTASPPWDGNDPFSQANMALSADILFADPFGQSSPASGGAGTADPGPLPTDPGGGGADSFGVGSATGMASALAGSSSPSPDGTTA